MSGEEAGIGHWALGIGHWAFVKTKRPMTVRTTNPACLFPTPDASSTLPIIAP